VRHTGESTHHGRVTTQQGRDVAIKLPTGTRLPPGTVLFLGDGFHVEVIAAQVDVWIIRAPEAATLVRVAYEIDNRHFPIEIGDGWVAVRYDHTLAELQCHGVTLELPRFGGHLILWEKGVPDAQESSPVPARVSAADGRASPYRTYPGGAGARV
jgi:hypothetical protein